MIRVLSHPEGALVHGECPQCGRVLEQAIGIDDGQTVEGKLVVAAGPHAKAACGSFLVLELGPDDLFPSAGRGLMRENAPAA